MPAPPPGLQTTPRPRAGPGQTAALRGGHRHVPPPPRRRGVTRSTGAHGGHRGMWGTRGDTRGPRGFPGPSPRVALATGAARGCAEMPPASAPPRGGSRKCVKRCRAPEVPRACARPVLSAPGPSRHRHRHDGEAAVQGPLLHQPLPRQHQPRYGRGRWPGRAGPDRTGADILLSPQIASGAREGTICGTERPSGASTCTGRRSAGERGPARGGGGSWPGRLPGTGRAGPRQGQATKRLVTGTVSLIVCSVTP